MTRHNDVDAFHVALRSSRRVLALCGAGLSASSGLPTFRGAGGVWRNYQATGLATKTAFETDPGVVWLFYAYRRHLALRAQPNDGHRALAALAHAMGSNFLTLTQNVDNLSQRAGHPTSQLLPLHGSLFDIKCAKETCQWFQRDNFDDPFCPALKPASVDMPNNEPNPLLNPYHRIHHITEDELPKCPQCKTGLQRPGVFWSQEPDAGALMRADEFLEGPVDMVLVLGTSVQVSSVGGYIDKARKKGARIVIIDPKAADDEEMYKFHPGDFAFSRDAAEALPVLLEPLIGRLQEDGTFQN